MGPPFILAFGETKMHATHCFELTPIFFSSLAHASPPPPRHTTT